MRRKMKWPRKKESEGTKGLKVGLVLMIMILTPKNAFVDPQQKVPYLILVCLARSSAEFTGEDIFDAVRKAGQENLINFSFLDQQTRQVCSVGGYHDEGEEPPQGSDHSG